MDNNTLNRGGYVPVVLTELSILKEDKVVSKTDCSQKHIGFSGVENFRMVENIFGLAQPTAEGITNILRYMQKDVIWMNLREEPVIYINGTPYVLRDKSSAFSNIRSFVGISYTRLEEMEERLKNDVLHIAQEHNGFIQVHAEQQAQSLKVNKVFVQKVQTVREVFEGEGRRIKYYRAPVSRKLYNKENFLSVLDTVFGKTTIQPGNTVFGFNCGHGFERTSYAMAACLVSSRIRQGRNYIGSLNKESPAEGEESACTPFSFHLETSDSQVLDSQSGLSEFSRIIDILERVHGKERLSEWLQKVGNVVPALEKGIRGEYTLIERLIGTFEGLWPKKTVDGVLGVLRPFSFLEPLLEHALRAQFGANPKRSLGKACILMERYVSLILYAIYKQQLVDRPFIEWIDTNPAVRGYIQQIATETPTTSLFSPVDLHAMGPRIIKDTRKWVAVIGARTILSADAVTEVCRNTPVNNMHILHQVSETDAETISASNAIWVNLRAEPVVYIGGVPHSERDKTSPQRNIKSIPGITTKLINTQEDRLCKRIRNEGRQMRGHIILFDATEDGEFITKRVDVKGKEVSVCAEYIKTQVAPKRYERIPMDTKNMLDPYLIDSIAEIVCTRDTSQIIFQASGYQGRARTAQMLAVVIETAMGFKDPGPRKALSRMLKRPQPIKGIETLLRILSNGPAAECLVRAAYIKCGHEDIYSVLEGSTDFNPSLLVNHFLMIACASFILQKPGPVLFRKWLNTRQDLMHIYTKLKTAPASSDVSLPLIERPWGNVLTPHTILKNDFFPALRVKKEGLADLKGCCNFRSVVFGENETIGVAQPTEWGIVSLAERVGGEGRRVHWFCLRQEPVVYLDGLPFVLRTTDMIYENVITEGITKEWVENIEERMKLDCIDECGSGGLTVHDEVFENNTPKLTQQPISVNIADILTPKEAFTKPENIVYYRVPISDEQAPLPEIFDELHQTILKIAKPRRLVFSCQMGRGRTTTGMIISGLVSFAEQLKGLGIEARAAILQSKRSDAIYDNEFVIISKLLQVLPMGRESKNVVDSLVRECEHIQNIYKAIHKAQCSGYLMRYFYLICFGSFLIENLDTALTFKEYLNERMEIDAISNEKSYQFKAQ
ncbi:hypothetical protein NEDG_01315 [Nematocida displodere]|uniref:Paladin n=1 Tax=Nematocida displodere TaxID=1805483 RepID=A0A177EDK2_9MICR|nr:hypothetical protein NEDG_01315 [Nematocida displodere]